MKVVINGCYGGFSLSTRALEEINKRRRAAGMFELDTTRPDDRSDPDLVAVVESLGGLANGKFAELKVVEIPDDVEWEINEYDGVEWVAEKHRTWPA